MRASSEWKVAALSAALMVSLSACAPREGAPVDESGQADELVATMEVEAGSGEVRLALHVTNVSAGPVELEFSTGQRFDFVVTRVNGEQLWRWSADRVFTQALGTETLAAGGTVRYTAEWPAPGVAGHYIATGEVTATNRTIRQSARFELAGDE